MAMNMQQLMKSMVKPKVIGVGLTAVVLIAVSMPYIPGLWEKRQDVRSQIDRIPKRNMGYEDVGRRLSLRFRTEDNPRAKQLGLKRLQLQRELSLWDCLLGFACAASLIGLYLIGKPAWRWWQERVNVLMRASGK